MSQSILAPPYRFDLFSPKAEDALRCCRVARHAGLGELDPNGFVALAEGQRLIGATFSGMLVGLLAYMRHGHWCRVELLAVADFFQRMGVGGLLVAPLLHPLEGDPIHTVQAMVPEVNLIAQLFFKSQGFLAVGQPQEINGHTYYQFERQTGVRVRIAGAEPITASELECRGK